jgi:hypothetical protein
MIVEINEFHERVYNLELSISKKKALAIIEELKDLMFKLLNNHDYNSESSIELMNNFRYEIEKIKIFYL